MLFHEKTRALVTILGVTFADTLVLIQLGLYLGLAGRASNVVDHLDADLWVTSRNAPSIENGRSLPESHLTRLQSIPGIEKAERLLVFYGGVRLPNGTSELSLVYGVRHPEQWGLPWRILDGDPTDLERGRNIFFDDSAAHRYGAFETGDSREMNGVRLRIVGRTAEAQSFTSIPIAFMDFRRARQVAGPRYASFIIAKVAPGRSIEAIRREIEMRLPTCDVHTKAEWAASCQDFWIKSTGIGLTLLLTVLVGCVVGMVIVAQTLYAATMEHLREFGTLKAIGGTNGLIYRILLMQGAIAAIFGFVSSLAPAFLARTALDPLGIALVFTPRLLGHVAVGTVLLCLLAATLPFRRISALDPAMVFRG